MGRAENLQVTVARAQSGETTPVRHVQENRGVHENRGVQENRGVHENRGRRERDIAPRFRRQAAAAVNSSTGKFNKSFVGWRKQYLAF